MLIEEDRSAGGGFDPISRSTVIGLAAFIAEAPRTRILNNAEHIQQLLQTCLDKIILKKQLEVKITVFKTEVETLRKKKAKLAQIYADYSNEVDATKQRTDLFLLNPEARPIAPREVVKYACLLNGTIRAPKNYRTDDRFLPLSFGRNQILLDEIEASILGFRYKQNKTYKKCRLPIVSILPNTLENILKRTDEHIQIKDYIGIQARPAEEETVQKRKTNEVRSRVIFTTNGSTPTINNYIDEPTDFIHVSKDTTLKFRTVMHGYIESDVYEVRISVETMAENRHSDFGMMVRPQENEFIFDENNGQANDSTFFNPYFDTWHVPENYSTPRD